MSNDKYLFAKKDNIYFIKFVGNIKYTISSDFVEFIGKIFTENNIEEVLLDLTETSNIDSTNLGLMAKIAQHMLEKYNKKTTIISTNTNINQILKSVGFDEVFIVIDKPDEVTKNLHEIPHITDSQRDMAKTILEAHKILMQVHEKNKEQFKNVVELLENDVSD